MQNGVATEETNVKVNLTLFFVGSPFGNSVASTLEGSSFKATAAGSQSSPMVTGLDRLRVKLPPPKPSSHDWYPVETPGTMEKVVQVILIIVNCTTFDSYFEY